MSDAWCQRCGLQNGPTDWNCCDKRMCDDCHDLTCDWHPFEPDEEDCDDEEWEET